MWQWFNKLMKDHFGPVPEPPKRKRPKLYERKGYTYTNKQGKEIHVKATTGGGKG